MVWAMRWKETGNMHIQIIHYLNAIISYCMCDNTLINYKDTTKCRIYWCLIEFIDWRYSHSCWYFRTSFVNNCPSNLLSGSPPPPKVKVQYIQTVCGWEGVGPGGALLSCAGDHIPPYRSLPLCFWPDSEPTTLLHYTTPNKNLGGEGAQTDKHLPLSPFRLIV